jgi:hypothetical protein
MNINDLIENWVCVVTLDGREIGWFPDERDAAAFVAHTYGSSPAGVAIGGLAGRGPRAGDLIQTSLGSAVLGHDGFATVQASTFRDDRLVSCSGGPCPRVDVDRLRFVGLSRLRCWRWADGSPGAHRDGHYDITVPVWQEEK